MQAAPIALRDSVPRPDPSDPLGEPIERDAVRRLTDAGSMYENERCHVAHPTVKSPTCTRTPPIPPDAGAAQAAVRRRWYVKHSAFYSNGARWLA